MFCFYCSDCCLKLIPQVELIQQIKLYNSTDWMEPIIKVKKNWINRFSAYRLRAHVAHEGGNLFVPVQNQRIYHVFVV